MRKVTFFLLLTLILTGNVAFAQGVEEKQKNIILIGLDGVGRRNVWNGIKSGTLPNMKKLSSDGVFVDITIVGETNSISGWAQILTGYDPLITGAFSNQMYQPIPTGYTIFERLKTFFGQDNFVTVAVTASKGSLGSDLPRAEFIGEQRELENATYEADESDYFSDHGKQYQSIPIGLFYFSKYGINECISDSGKNVDVGKTTLGLLEKYKAKPFFFFVRFTQADAAGHKYGEDSSQYSDQIVLEDDWIGKIMQKLKELNLDDKTLIYVTADHGFNLRQKRHYFAPYVFLVTNDKKVIRSGELKDIAPTILSRFGLDLRSIEPPLQGHPLTQPHKLTDMQE